MPSRNPVTISRNAVTPRVSNVQRLADQGAAAASRQAELKREAADRRAARALRDASAAPPAGPARAPRRHRPS